ncbi:hypothetical protein FJZ39_04445 [Candidatus Saccharibacteria bacterium]|nr:hypothetical protein [Candidatus Saccharibacteria bacterium]
MNIYFSGIGGVGIGPLAEIAFDAGHSVAGSDQKDSLTSKELARRGIAISLNQDGTFLSELHERTPIDVFVHTAALPLEHPELAFARAHGIKIAKRDWLLAKIIKDNGLKLIAASGTHGKTTTTGMLVWTMIQLGIPVSYSIGTTLSWGPSGLFSDDSRYFIYECDEFDKNFLHFSPHTSLITTIDYDHPDTYPTEDSYLDAFGQFITQSERTILWHKAAAAIDCNSSPDTTVVNEEAPLTLAGAHNRQNAALVAEFIHQEFALDHDAIYEALNRFPGTFRRFERVADGMYTDYGHHPVEIAATLQMARELNDQVVLVYQPHQNIRQHQIKNDYTTQFELADTVYWLPTYLSREDPLLPILPPQDLITHITNKDAIILSELDEELWRTLQVERNAGKLILFMGAGSIDNWLREQL